MRQSVPLYHHLKSELIQRIDSGTWKRGELIPSEAQLMEEFAVSRTTVRQALGDLVSMGHLVRRQGRGTYVADYSPMPTAAPLYGFIEELVHQGRDIVVQDSTVQRVKCPEKVADFLGLRPDTPVVWFTRLVLDSGTPLFSESSYFLLPLLLRDDSGILESPTFLDRVYAFLEQQGVKISRGRQDIAAELATVADAQTLKIDSGDALLTIRRITYDETGDAIEYSEVRYAAQRYRYQVDLQRMQRERDDS